MTNKNSGVIINVLVYIIAETSGIREGGRGHEEQTDYRIVVIDGDDDLCLHSYRHTGVCR